MLNRQAAAIPPTKTHSFRTLHPHASGAHPSAPPRIPTSIDILPPRITTCINNRNPQPDTLTRRTPPGLPSRSPRHTHRRRHRRNRRSPRHRRQTRRPLNALHRTRRRTIRTTRGTANIISKIPAPVARPPNRHGRRRQVRRRVPRRLLLEVRLALHGMPVVAFRALQLAQRRGHGRWVGWAWEGGAARRVWVCG